MRQVFSDDYYTYNTISSPDNFCLVRASSYRGVKFGVVLEFQKKLFAKYLSGVGSHHVYLLGSNDLIQMHYADSAEEKDDLLQPLEITSSAVCRHFSHAWSAEKMPHSEKSGRRPGFEQSKN